MTLPISIAPFPVVPLRKIIHLDMDCFYAAVEMRERPELAGRPIAVGGGSARGVVTTCNYEARAFGVRSAMPGFKARELCPDLVFLPVRFDLYRAESAKVRAILHSVTDLVEPLSLDEAYLDVTGQSLTAWELAKRIRAEIFETTGLTASAGVAPNKMLAKIASDWRKPNGQYAVTPDLVESFMRDLPVGKIFGIGPKTRARLEAMSVTTCGELQQWSMSDLVAAFGRWGVELYALCRGQDNRAVEPNRPRKSLSTESTFSTNLNGLVECTNAMESILAELEGEIQAKQVGDQIRKVFVKVKFADFSRTTCECVADAPERGVVMGLLEQALTRRALAVRLLGVGVRFRDEPEPGSAIQAAFEF